MSSATRHEFSSQELLCRVPPSLVKRAKEKQDWMLEIVSRYIVHLKIIKYNNSATKTLVFKRISFFLYLFKLSYFLIKINFK